MSDDTFDKKSQDLIRYDRLAQDALRGVVKRVIEEVAEVGELPGNHHFYVTFDTNAAGVKISKVMKDKYPDEMTIVIQHQYWDLKATRSGFSITLSFNDQAEKLKVPYNSITGFFDPSVEFGLQFEAEPMETDNIITERSAQSAHKTNAQNTDDKNDDPDDNSDDKPTDTQQTADVVMLDKFRKK